MDIKLEDLKVQETMSIGDLGMSVTSVGGGGNSIQFEEDPVDSGYVKYNQETGFYSTEEIDLSGKADIEYVDEIAKTIPKIELTLKDNGAYTLTINKG